MNRGDKMMKLNTFQKVCLAVNSLGLVVHLMHYYAPESWVAWGVDIESPAWASILGNQEEFLMIDMYRVPKYLPLLIYISMMLYIPFMYRFEKKRGGF